MQASVSPANVAATRGTAAQSVSRNGSAQCQPDAAAVAALAAQHWTPNNLKLGKELGEGTFSTVYMAQIVDNGAVVHPEVAVKVCDQANIVRKKAVDVIMTEKEAMTRIDHKLCVRLICTMKDSERLYFIMTYCPRGELLSWIRRLGNFNIECARFYSGELLEACEYLNTIGIVHRDVKPENCYLMQDFQLKLGDFGSAYITGFPRCPSYTGTPHYAAPEMLLQTARGDHTVLYTQDLWAIGCCLFQFLSGLPPFRGRDDFSVIQQAASVSYEFPDQFDPVARDLVSRLLVKDPSSRLGSPGCGGGFAAVRGHEFFAGLPFGQLVGCKPPELGPNLPPLAPRGTNEGPPDWENIPLGYAQGVRELLNAELLRASASGARDKEQKMMVMAREDSRGAALPVPTADEMERLRREQERANPYHRFCRQQVIIRQGILYKRRGLFARKRMFLLTFGPHLFYVDPDKMDLKGEVPWDSGKFMQFERRTSKLFCIHVVNRTYYLEDPSEHADEWIEELQRVKSMYHLEN